MKANTHSILCLIRLFACFALLSLATASCEPPVPFAPPTWINASLNATFRTIEATLKQYFASEAFQSSSCSVQISSSDHTLWNAFHTANGTQAGAPVINGSVVYRIASNTKIFTAMAILQQQAEGKINLDDPITQYVANLGGGKHDHIRWDRISARSLMSHMSGIQDNYAENDLLALGGASALGLPPVSAAIEESLPACDLNETLACSTAGLLGDLKSAFPVFPPHQQASYSNVGFDVLGLAIANITGMAYEDYVYSAIMKPLGLSATTFTTPDPRIGAIPTGESQWGENLGIDNASGGLYSSSDDMIRLLRYVLSNYETLSPTLNWLLPVAYSTGSHSLLGMPWEIFRTTAILTDTNRPVTFVTKGGGLIGYYSYSILIPEYDLAVSILLSGDLGALNPLLEKITTPLVKAAEDSAQRSLKDSYAGTYVATDGVNASADLNSSITLEQSPSRSLFVSQWISNGTDVLPALTEFVAAQAGDGGNIYYQLIPTFEERLSGSQIGQVWRLTDVLNTPTDTNHTGDVWNDYCVSNVDPIIYAGKPLNEVVFWGDAKGVTEIELSAFRIVLSRQ